MPTPFIGAEALAAGRLTRHRLRTGHSVLFPGVYYPNGDAPTLYARTIAAWLWSKRTAVVAGAAAAAIHGSKWVDGGVPIELISPNTNPPKGIIARNDALLDGEMVRRRGLPVTSVARTAFDIGRRGPTATSVMRLDDICRTTGLSIAAIAEVADRHAGARGVVHLRRVLDLVDSGAESPKETWLRLLIIEGGIPAPTTQIRVVDGGWSARLDMGWEEVKVAVEYDGDHHRTDRRQYVRDVRRMERLQHLGWIVVRVVAEDRPGEILGRVRQALASRPPRRGVKLGGRAPDSSPSVTPRRRNATRLPSQRTHSDDLAHAMGGPSGLQT